MVLEAFAAKLDKIGEHAVSSAPVATPLPPPGRPLIEEISCSPCEHIPDAEGGIHDDIDLNKAESYTGEPGKRSSSKEEDSEFLTTALSMLSTMLAYGAGERKEAEEMALRGLLPSLQHIAAMELEITVAEAATDVAVAIMTREVPTKGPAAPFGQIVISADAITSAKKDINDTSQDIPTLSVNSSLSLIDMCVSISREFLRDEHPAMRALGVRHINTALKATKEVRAILIESLSSMLNILSFE